MGKQSDKCPGVVCCCLECSVYIKFQVVITFSPHRDYDREQFAENPVPLLLIGTKFDQIPENKRSEVLTRTTFLSEDFNAEEINLVG